MLNNKTQTYTLHEFLVKSRIGEFNKLERLAIIAEHNKHLKAAMIIFIANIFYIQDQLNYEIICAATGNPLEKLNLIGMRFLGIAQVFGYWICIIMCVVDIIKSLMQGDTKGAGKIFVKYLLAFICLYGVKWAFDEVRYVFQQ